MAKREKKILLLLLSAIGLYLVGLFCYWTFYMPWKGRFDDEAKREEKIRLAGATKGQIGHLKTAWAELGARTYSADAEKMVDAIGGSLRAVMNDEAGDTTGRVKRPLYRAGNHALVSPRAPLVKGNISAEASADMFGQGGLDAVFRVLYEAQHNPRLGRVAGVTIKRDKDSYQVDINYVTKWLGQPTVIGTPMHYTVADLSQTKIAPFEGSPYASLAGDTMFTLWRPPQVAKAPEPPPVRVPNRPDVPPPPPPPPPPPDYKNLEVTSICRIQYANQAAQVYAEVRDKNTQEIRKVHEGQDLADGKIAALNPERNWLVLEVGGQAYVVEAGKTIGDRVPRERHWQSLLDWTGMTTRP